MCQYRFFTLVYLFNIIYFYFFSISSDLTVINICPQILDDAFKFFDVSLCPDIFLKW